MTISNELRFRVLEKCGFRCVYCGNSSVDKLQIEHILPISKGGTDIFSNLVAACPKCNNGKGNRIISPVVIENLLRSLRPDKPPVNTELSQLVRFYLDSHSSFGDNKIQIGTALNDIEPVTLQLQDRFCSPLFVTGGKGVGKTSFLASLALQDREFPCTQLFVGVDDSLRNIILTRVIQMLSAFDDNSLDNTILIDPTADYLLPICLPEAHLDEETWISVLYKTIQWSYRLKGKKSPLQMSYIPRNWDELWNFVHARFPQGFIQLRSLFSPQSQKESLHSKFLEVLMREGIQTFLQAGTDIESVTYSMIVGDKIVETLIKNGNRNIPFHIYVDGFLDSTSRFFIETLLRVDTIPFTLTISESYENLALLKGIALDYWTEILSVLSAKGNICAFGIGQSDERLVEGVVDDISRLMFDD